MTNKFVLPVLISVMAVIIILAFIITQSISNENKEDFQNITQQKQEIEKSYKQAGISLDKKDIIVDDNGNISVNEDKEKEYKNQLNEKLKSIQNSKTNQYNKTQQVDYNPNNYKDIDSLIEETKAIVNQLRDLYKYFDNSKFIDMSSGITYQEEYFETVHQFNENKYKFIEEQRKLHPEMTEDEFNEYINILILNDPQFTAPSYDNSKEDINIQQITKAYGFLSFLNLPEKFNTSDIKSYKASFSKYISEQQIDTENNFYADVSFDKPLFENFLTNKLYLNDFNFEINKSTINDNNTYYYVNDNINSLITISDSHWSIVFYHDGSEFKIADIYYE